MSKITKNILNSIGFNNIYEAQNGIEAMEVLNKESIDLVLSDWNMPKMDGLELLKSIRANKRLKDLYVLMVTKEGGDKKLIEAIKSGVNGYISKPFTKETLIEKINAIYKSLNDLDS